MMKPTKLQARIIGILFILPLLFYGIGNSLLIPALDNSVKGVIEFQWLPGALLIFFNSVTVLVLGVRLYRGIRIYQQTTAQVYLAARVIEAIVLIIGLIFLVAAMLNQVEMELAKTIHFFSYQGAMFVLGAGSIGLCLLLHRTRLIPGWMGAWGMIGYSLLAVGSVAEVCGLEIGILLSVPGGLFELTLGVYLLARGFKE